MIDVLMRVSAKKAAHIYPNSLPSQYQKYAMISQL